MMILFERGQALFYVSKSQVLADGAEAYTLLDDALQSQLSSIKTTLHLQESHYQQDKRNIHAQLQLVQDGERQLVQQADLLTEQYEYQANKRARIAKLYEQGFASHIELARQDQELRQIKHEQSRVDMAIAQQAQQRLGLRQSLIDIEQQHVAQQTSMLEQQSLLKQQVINRAMQTGQWVIAPRSGYISNLNVYEGMELSSQPASLSIFPASANVQVVVLVPSRAIAFIQPGQVTNIRIDAFPYQRFGTIPGEIIKMNKYITLPGEKAFPIEHREAVFEVTMAISQQSISAYGQAFPLQAGMTLSADIVLEQRNLISWLFEPILSLRGRV